MPHPRRSSSINSVNSAFSTASFNEAHGLRDISLSARIQNAISILLILFERLITTITFILPKSVISICTRTVRFLLNYEKSDNSAYNRLISQEDKALKEDVFLQRVEALRSASNFEELCEINGFVCENHLVSTKDGYTLTMQRLNPTANGYEPNGKTVYFQHGLLMSSEIWCVRIKKDENLPFKICQLGYDVFMGNNRGNKYSGRCQGVNVHNKEFWDFSIDEFALYDLPACINYILELKNISHLTYIGFSQGCSQILASLSINRDLNQKIDKLVLIAPATTPKSLANWLINSIVNLQPKAFFFLFGRKALMKSILFWSQIVYPPLFIKLIDFPNQILFDWHANNIDILQKLVAYFHLYSTTSVKCVVHWFQIIRSNCFQMYQESHNFEPYQYPIHTVMNVHKVLLIYGMSDSLVDIDVMLRQLPDFGSINFECIQNSSIHQDEEKEEDTSTISSKAPLVVDKDNVKVIEETDSIDSNVQKNSIQIVGVENHEHLDLIWGEKVQDKINDRIIKFLQH